MPAEQPSERYHTELGYLTYSSSSDRLSIPIRLRERHLTPEANTAQLQLTGPYLQIMIRSDRDDVLIRVPLTGWEASKPYQATLSGDSQAHIAVDRFAELIDNDGDTVAVEVERWGS